MNPELFQFLTPQQVDQTSKQDQMLQQLLQAQALRGGGGGNSNLNQGMQSAGKGLGALMKGGGGGGGGGGTGELGSLGALGI